jgi:drug/metabolite transporter (DMT)-like permease
VRARPTEVARPQNPALGIAFLVCAVVLIPISDAFAKMLAAKLPAIEVVWLRYVSQTALILPFVLWRYGRRTFVTRYPVTQLVRSVLITGAAFCFFTALSTVPLADAVAVFFVSPFIVTALSPAVLGERVGVWRWCAVIFGFIGAMVVIRPGFQQVELGLLFAIGAGTCFALFVLATRRLAGGDPPLVTTFLTGLGAMTISAIAVPFIWVPPTADMMWPFLAMGLLGCLFSLFVVLAYEHAGAAQLAPFSYIEIAAAAVVGWIIFNELPDAISWIGISMIVGSGLVIVWREHRALRAARKIARKELPD